MPGITYSVSTSSGSNVFSVEENKLVRAVLDVELFRGNFRGLIKA